MVGIRVRPKVIKVSQIPFKSLADHFNIPWPELGDIITMHLFFWYNNIVAITCKY